MICAMVNASSRCDSADVVRRVVWRLWQLSMSCSKPGGLQPVSVVMIPVPSASKKLVAVREIRMEMIEVWARGRGILNHWVTSLVTAESAIALQKCERNLLVFPVRPT